MSTAEWLQLTVSIFLAYVNGGINISRSVTSHAMDKGCEQLVIAGIVSDVVVPFFLLFVYF